jgi:hypothetical protein
MKKKKKKKKNSTSPTSYKSKHIGNVLEFKLEVHS